jgi:molybdopterin converting factor subunit 1
VRVPVKLFARLRDVAGTGEIVRDVPAGATVRSLWSELVAEFPEIASYERSISTAINADYAKMDQRLADGDEVAFLPPVSGG